MTDVHLLASAIVAQTFRLQVQAPVSQIQGKERFPVLYVTDSDMFFHGLGVLASTLQAHGETQRFILVGIGYENARLGELLRQRDFYTHAVRQLYRRETERVARSQNLEVVEYDTDAGEFLRFIREELMPYIDGRYPTRVGDNGYFGYSAGGAFGLYTLFTQPGTFKRYILGSPTTSYAGHRFAIPQLQTFIDSGRSLDADVFLSVGELEELSRGLAQFELVTGLYGLAKALRQADIAGLRWRMRVFPGETHATAWTLAFSHGLRALFCPVDQAPC